MKAALLDAAEVHGVPLEMLDALTEYAAYVGDAGSAAEQFESAFIGQAAPDETFDDFAHRHTLESDPIYRAAFEGNLGWSPLINMVDFSCHHHMTRSGYVFQAV
ncbi:hypothetical protein ACFZCK_14125 [Kitasatospora purpeofusca]|uniref:hypothetical protein n=1 Tax=Kitasatospora purpeofusca TaxID=67352 RepID=UPI0036EF555B